jgi:hypothetical protein
MLVRLGRSIQWIFLFFILGSVAGTSLITWEYLQPPFEPGSEMEEELLEEIADAIEFHPLVDSLRQANWIEENYYADHAGTRGQRFGEKGLHLVAGKLQGIQGLSMKTFKHPTQHFTMMIAFLGFGLEGWPDVVHGGLITSLIQEGIERHIQNFYRKHGNQHAQAISIDFKRSMRPGDVYAVLVPPAQLETNPPQPEVMHLQMTPTVLRMDFPPRIDSGHMSVELHSEDDLHALANVQVRMVKEVSVERMAELEAGFAKPSLEQK